jgi:hypothetical protein
MCSCKDPPKNTQKNRALFEELEVTVKEQGKQNPTGAGRLETPLLAHERQAGKQRVLALCTRANSIGKGPSAQVDILEW